MRRYLAVLMVSVALIGVSLPANAATEWEVRIKITNVVTSGGNVTAVDGTIVSKNFVCRMAAYTVYAYHGPNFATTYGSDNIDSGSFHITGSVPVGTVIKVVRPQSKHSGDNGKKHVCLKASKKVDTSV